MLIFPAIGATDPIRWHSLQTLDLMRRGAALRAGLNVVPCIAAVAAGHALAAHYNEGAQKIAQIDSEEDA